MVFLLVCACYFDVKLLLFIKHFNKINPSAMVPWTITTKANSQGLRAHLETSVPVISSLISLGFLIILSILMAIAYSTSDSNLSQTFWVLNVASLLNAIHLPVVVFISVRQRQKTLKSRQVQVPTRLQFHDDDVEMNDEQDFKPAENGKANL